MIEKHKVWFAAGLLLIMLAQMAASSPAQSAAFDETYRVTFGYAYLRTGDTRLSLGQNPPLADVLLALPLLLRNDIVFPIDHPTWATVDVFGFADEFLWKANADKAHALVMLARLPAMALTLLLAVLIYAGAQCWLGERAGLLALALVAFDPNLIAHGRIAGNDLPLAVFVFGAVLCFERTLISDSRRWAVLSGVFCGAALASKYTALWLIPTLIGIAALYPVHVFRKTAFARRVMLLLIVGAVSLGVIWATFGFAIGPIAPGGVPLPAPAYWSSIGGVADRIASNTPAFLNRRISVDGFLEYYPIAFLVKTPLPTLLLMTAGTVALIRKRDRRLVVLGLPCIVFLIGAIVGRLNLGYRLILLLLPFVLIIAGHGAAALVEWGSLNRKERKGREENPITPLRSLRPLRLALARPLTLAVGALAAWLALGTLAVFPNHLTFFNELAGGSSNGYRVLVDSNYDWGQDLIALREWMNRHQVDRASLAYFGSAHVDAYGLRVDLLPGFNQNDFGADVDGYSAYAAGPGWTAISATSLQLGLLFTHWEAYAAFRDRAPDDRVGSILLYRVPEAARPSRTIVLGPSAIDLDGATLGAQPDTPVSVAWAGDGAAVFAMDGPARYITRGGEPLAGFAPDVHDALIANAKRLGSDASGHLRLFEIDARVALEAKLNTLQPSTDFEGGLTLAGYDLRSVPGRPIELVTYWRVRERPAAHLSIFAHIVDAAGQIVAQGDGLNVRLASLEPGDVILQHFVIDRPASASALEIGLYDPSDNRRMSIALPNGQAIDRVRVTLP